MFIYEATLILFVCFFFFSSRRRHTRCSRDWSSDVCSSDLVHHFPMNPRRQVELGSSGSGGLGHLAVKFAAGFGSEVTAFRSEERRVGKGVDLGGRRIIKKKKKKDINNTRHDIQYQLPITPF